MKINNLEIEHKFFEINFELYTQKDKEILKQIIENFLLVEYTRNCDCFRSKGLKLNKKYLFQFDYEKKEKTFKEIE